MPMRLQSLSRHHGRFATAFKPKAGPAVDPIAHAWRISHPRVPVPYVLRADNGGILGRRP